MTSAEREVKEEENGVHHCVLSTRMTTSPRLECWGFNMSLDVFVFQSCLKMYLDMLSEQQVPKPKPAKGHLIDCFRMNHTLAIHLPSSLPSLVSFYTMC